ncbi:TIR_domain-containing protein [Hexamita inflata]|uniref:TIR_domain-containing protein n=1 Tax=Hexamita inflata TaxID=28002 RepID=A0ABP1HRG5_9EUKA
MNKRKAVDLKDNEEYNACSTQTKGVIQYEDSMYQGDILNKDIKHGHGVQIWTDDNKTQGRKFYEGQYSKDQYEGEGEMIYASGHSYKGCRVNKLYHGYGVFKYKNGNILEGEFQQSRFVSGRLTFIDGSCFDINKNEYPFKPTYGPLYQLSCCLSLEEYNSDFGSISHETLTTCTQNSNAIMQERPIDQQLPKFNSLKVILKNINKQVGLFVRSSTSKLTAQQLKIILDTTMKIINIQEYLVDEKIWFLIEYKGQYSLSAFQYNGLKHKWVNQIKQGKPLTDEDFQYQ